MKFSRFIRKRRFMNVLMMITVAMAMGMIFIPALSMGASTEEGHGEGHSETKGWVKTDTYRVMNFTVLAIILFVILRKPASQALNGRIENIRNQLEDLEAKKQEAEKKLAEYNDQISLLDQEAETIIAQYVKQGEDAKVRILKEAENAAVKLEAQAQRNIEQEFKTAKQKLQEDIMKKALEKAEAIVKKKMTAKDQDRLVAEYLDKVVAQ
jgi:F-type H+-transporting ATPase subunit b